MTSRLRKLREKIRFLLRLPETAESPVLFSKYIPSRAPGAELGLKYAPSGDGKPLAVPPRELWLGYGHDEESYLRSGEHDIGRMRELLAACGHDLAQTSAPVLDLGCGGGRMIRHLRSLAERCDVWGLDISAAHIGWLKTHLTPPFRFAVNTTLPHLPFSDGHFGLVYCGSVFTHIDDLAESWFLEINRVLRDGGLLYCTLHDEHARARLQAEPGHPLARWLQGHPLMDPRADVPDIVVTGQGHDCNVYYRSEYLKAMLAPLFEVVRVEPGAYGYQTAWILKKAPRR